MEKEKYVIPQAIEERFVPNSYAAKCGLSITKNGMRCINPYHNHYNDRYFASVWKAGDLGDVCEIKITPGTPKSSSGGGMTVPEGDPCLFLDGVSRNANHYVNENGISTYVPYYVVPNRFNNKMGEPYCYGSYRFDGAALDLIQS